MLHLQLYRFIFTSKGGSRGSTNIVRVWLGKVRDSGLNMAVSAALTVDLMSQARELVRRVKGIPGAAERWKMVSVLVGHNDLCYKSCKGFLNNFIPRTRVSVEDYETNLRKGIINLLGLNRSFYVSLLVLSSEILEVKVIKNCGATAYAC